MRSPRNRSITPLGFECFRLEATGERDPAAPAFIPVRLVQARNAMRAFTRLG